MSEFKGTPGPWPIEWSAMIEIGGIAVVPQALDGKHTANAKLIAAAPDLLYALEAVVHSWTSQFESRGHLAPEWCKQARAAIAKATE